ncbi:MAG: universal stress protein [Bacteroidota bacterium]
MKNILIPTDFSENAWNALQYIQKLYSKVNCNFYLLHVSDFIDYTTAPVYKDKQEAQLSEKATIPSKRQLNELLKLVETSFSNNKHSYYGIHDNGFFIDSVKRHIAEKKIDLIVMGTKGATGMRQRIIGSNAGDVITKVPCNAMIIPKGVGFVQPQEVAFPTDYNIFYSPRILKAIDEVMELGKAKMRVMNVTKADSHLNEVQERNQEYLSDYLNATFPSRNTFHTITNKSVKSAIQCFVESRDIDMIVMVAKNLNFIQQILFDSLVEKISFHTKVPFLVIHE